MIPAQLTAEVEELRTEQHEIELHNDRGGPVVIIKNYPVLPGFSATSTELLLRFPPSYPNGKPDMFWTSQTLVLKGGGVPKNADSIETIVGRQWRRFSWHISAWNPGRDNLRTFLEFVNSRFAQAA